MYKANPPQETRPTKSPLSIPQSVAIFYPAQYIGETHITTATHRVRKNVTDTYIKSVYKRFYRDSVVDSTNDDIFSPSFNHNSKNV